MMRRFSQSCLLLALLTVVNTVNAEEKVDPLAAKMMLRAQQARSTWGDNFPGFRAKVYVSLDGEVTQGSVTINRAGEIALNMKGEAAKWAERQLGSMVMHRQAGARSEYEVSFADEVTDHPLGRLIKFHGGTTHSLYRVKDDVITEVHRTMEKVKFTITVTQVDRNPDGKTLPHHFNVSYWDPASGSLLSNKDYQVQWGRVGGYDLPLTRLLVTTSAKGRTVEQLKLSDHALLPAPDAGK